MSEPTNVAGALAKAQAEMLSAPKNGYNPHFRNNFSTLEDLIEASRTALTKHGLSVSQYPDSVGEEIYLVTLLMHASGERIESRIRIFLKDPTDIQKLGSALSYLKRYAYAAICGIATSESDDDGNSNGALAPDNKPSAPMPNMAYNTPTKSDAISVKQLGFLRAKIGNKPGKEQEICKKYGINSLADLSWRKMDEVISSLVGDTPQQKSINAQSVVTNPNDFEEMPF